MMMQKSSLVIHLLWLGFLVVSTIGSLQGAAASDEGLFQYHIRRKREVQCADKYAKVRPSHTACLQPSRKATEKGVSNADKRTIVTEHNRARREVSPAAAMMMKMSWDDEVANVAQRWAENCVIEHDKGYDRYVYGRFSVGQNLAWSSGQMGWKKAMSLWENEKKDFRYGGPNNSGAVIGHYTQMVWGSSSKIGCGYALCGGTHYYVCNYGPAGNFNKDTPYTSGSQCDACKGRCDNGLCDCGGRVCLNGGDMDFNTCTCKCTKNLPYYIHPYCALNCTDIQETSFNCRRSKSDCTQYSNIPAECPKLCGWCPYAGYDYGDDDVSGTNRLVASSYIFVLLVVMHKFIRRLQH